MYQTYGYEHRLFSCLNFPGTVILNFCDSLKIVPVLSNSTGPGA